MRKKLIIAGYLIMFSMLTVMARQYFAKKHEVKVVKTDPKISTNYNPKALDNYWGNAQVERFLPPEYPQIPKKKLGRGITYACTKNWTPNPGDNVAYVNQASARALANLSSTYVYVLENICYKIKQEIQLKDEFGRTFAKAIVRNIIHHPQVSGNRRGMIHDLMALHRKYLSNLSVIPTDLAMLQVIVQPESIDHSFYKERMTMLPKTHAAVPAVTIADIQKMDERQKRQMKFLRTTRDRTVENPFMKDSKLLILKNDNGFIQIANADQVGISKASKLVVFGRHSNDYNPIRAIKYLRPFGFKGILWLTDPNQREKRLQQQAQLPPTTQRSSAGAQKPKRPKQKIVTQ